MSTPRVRFNAERFAARVKAAIGERSYRAVQHECGVSSATLNRIARGERPDIDTYVQLSWWLSTLRAAP